VDLKRGKKGRIRVDNFFENFGAREKEGLTARSKRPSFPYVRVLKKNIHLLISKTGVDLSQEANKL